MPGVRFDPPLKLIDLDRMSRRLLANLDRDIHPIKHVLFRPEAGIQSGQTTDRSFEQGFWALSGRICKWARIPTAPQGTEAVTMTDCLNLVYTHDNAKTPERNSSDQRNAIGNGVVDA